jgi:hypothetical protein
MMAADASRGERSGSDLRPPSPVASLEALRRLVGEARRLQRAPRERCELCSAPLPAQHRHLCDPLQRQALCVCDPCALLFRESVAAPQARYRLIPERYLALEEFQMSAAVWEELLIPVGMAYLFESTPAGRVVACYPGPAGATESLLALERWARLREENPILETLAPDVEALLINRVHGADEYYLVPIDACYRLVGVIRRAWRGLSGGEEARRAIAAFFAELRARSQVVRGGPHARPEF